MHCSSKQQQQHDAKYPSTSRNAEKLFLEFNHASIHPTPRLPPHQHSSALAYVVWPSQSISVPASGPSQVFFIVTNVPASARSAPPISDGSKTLVHAF